MTAIAAIKAVDNHCHPLRTLKEGERDSEWDGLSYQTQETPATDPRAEMALIPFRLRPTSPEYMAVWQTLYGFPPGPLTKERVQELIQLKQRIKREQGDNYPTWALDKIGIETPIRAEGPLPQPPRRWVPERWIFVGGWRELKNRGD